VQDRGLVRHEHMFASIADGTAICRVFA
jgi:hypothetical protein